MEQLQAALKYLAERGITAHRTLQGAYRCGISHGEGATLDMVLRDDRWWISQWGTAPGPGLDDFMASYLLLDDALLAIWGYFYAQPVALAGWVIPLHRYPYWSLAKLQYRLATLPQLSEQRFEAIQDARAKRSLSPLPIHLQDRLAIAEQSQFFSFHRAEKAHQRLVIRRDLEEAYIVHGDG